MHTRRFSMLVLGLWTGLTLAMLFVATQNFRGVDRLLDAPSREARGILENVGHQEARMLLRYQIAELNRFFFDWFGIAQIVLALLLALTLLFATNGNKVTISLSAGLLILVLFEQFFLLPEITYLGRLIDFIPKTTPSPARDRFSSFHVIFLVMELTKMLLFLAVAWRMLARGEPRRKTPRPSELGEESLLMR